MKGRSSGTFIQPVDMIGYLLSLPGSRTRSRTLSGLPYHMRSSSTFAEITSDCLPDPLTFLGFLVARASWGFLVGFYFEAAWGMVGFWILEVTSLLYIVMTLNFFISGSHVSASTLLPHPWSDDPQELSIFRYMAIYRRSSSRGR